MIDHEKVEQAVRLLLEGIGEDVNREGLIDTPDRIARMYEEIYGGMEEDAATHLSRTFTVDSSEMVVEKDITFYSTCEHHLLPFYGKVHIGYIPDGKVVGLSKLARTVEVFARRLQLQDGAYAGKRRNRDDRGGAYVHDYARNQEAGKPDGDAGKTWSLRDRPGTGRTIFPHVGEIAMLMEKYIEMPRLNAVWNHPLYQKYYRENEKIEHDREFCCHQITHLLDVARIAYIKNLEAGLGIDKELIYTAAILHDIGKALQYTDKIPHEIAGEKIAGEILDTLSENDTFSETERAWILEAVRGHRRKCNGMSEVARLFYECDKRSRNCFACPVKEQCNWSEEEKNMEIKI